MGEIKDPEIGPLETIDEALVADIMKIAHECAALPDHDTRSPDEVLGYDEHGLPQ
ncbi:hypothetical protein C882_1266 [Caenispirillum salinarum AK4]|uniref:Uncharacterized protein n=2 Tax=Caenispirillum TaxID=414051 RepID=K9HGD8_9PROT|nr:hypothetical protein C882_1266 [Caenispirillum salinarum AK4]